MTVSYTELLSEEIRCELEDKKEERDKINKKIVTLTEMAETIEKSKLEPEQWKVIRESIEILSYDY